MDKGEYTLRLSIRHENRALLERLTELPVVVQQRLAQPITLDVYSDQPQVRHTHTHARLAVRIHDKSREFCSRR